MEQTERILKRDVLGRIWTPGDQREAAVEEFARSGLPAMDFAARIGVRYSTFCGWVRKRRRQDSGGATAGAAPVPAALRWVEAVVASPVAGVGSGLAVYLPGGARLEIRDVAQAELAVHVLRGLSVGGGALPC